MTTTFLSPDTRGTKPLWVVFWIYGVLVSHVLFGTIIYFYQNANTTALAIMLAVFVAYTAWIMRSIWVNAFNVKNETFGYLARYLTVAWALNAVLVSIFLVLGHFGTVALPI